MFHFFFLLLLFSHCVLAAYISHLFVEIFLHVALHLGPRYGFLRDNSRGQDPLVRSSTVVSCIASTACLVVPESASVDKNSI